MGERSDTILRALAALVFLLGALGCDQQDVAPSTLPPVIFADQVPRSYQTYSKAQLPLLRDSDYLAAHVELRDEARPAITGSLGSKLTFNAPVPDQPVLRFAIAVTALSSEAPRGPVRFRVTLETREGREVVFDELVKRRRRGRWLRREVDLAPFVGSDALVTLEARLDTEEPETRHDDLLPLWANPVLSSNALERERPNLILVSIDTLRADHLGTYGYDRPTTPHIDAFASTALRFTNALATAPWTVPSHYSMLTGLLPSQHGVSDYFEEYWQGGRKLSLSVPYLPDTLSSEGYDTYGVYSHFAVSTTYGFERGYSAYRRVGTDAKVVIDHAIDYLRQASASDERPFFLFVHLVDPHWPYLPPTEFRAYAREFIEPLGAPPENISDLLTLVEKRIPPENERQVDDVKLLYDAAISYTDRELGRLFEELRQLGMDEDALTIVTSDHGEAFVEHDEWQHATTLYEEMVRVPMLVSWPSRLSAADVADPVSLVDIFPTFLEAAGIASSSSSAVSLAMTEPEVTANRTRHVIAEVTLMGESGYETTIAIRARNFKYIAVVPGNLDALDVDAIGREQLYDLAADAGETHDLADDVATDLDPFRNVLRMFIDESRRMRSSYASGGVVETDRELQRQLKALGYVN